ncbi:MAG: hypothetical protein AAB496_01945 [Patescibacteria group bacterium]
MLKKFLISFLVILFLSSGFAFVVFANGGAVHGQNSETTMKMDDMMSAMMGENKSVNCAGMDSTELIEKGEELMSKMMGGDEEKHELVEESMEKTGGVEFHDMMHIMMGRMASGCFTDEQQKTVASKLTAVAPQRTNQTLPLVTGIVIGLVIGLVGMSFLKRPTT